MLSIVIPAFNEEGNIANVVKATLPEVQKTGMDHEIIIVDDGSSDNTWGTIKTISAQYPSVKGIKLSRNFGKESAICAGLEQAAGDAVVIMDCDLQHPPHYIPEMVKVWRETGADIVECVKQNRSSESLVNRAGAFTFYKIINWLSGYDLNGASDFKLLNRSAVDSWKTMPERNLFFRGMSRWLGFHRETVEITIADREVGTSAWSFFRLIGLAVTAVTSFSSLPLRLVTIFGALFLVLALGLGIQTIYMFIAGKAVTGFTTVILLLLIIGSLLMLSLGIIGEYIAAIYREVKQRPRYLVAERTFVNSSQTN
ncbi:MAG: glycosyltransferase family 2 protein [Candidatus Saccharibacteria bacterium]